MFPTFTDSPVEVNAAISAVTAVPKGTVTVMVLAFSSMVPVTAGLVIENAVIAFVPDGAALPPPPPPQAVNNNERHNINTAEIVRHCFLTTFPPFAHPSVSLQP